MSSREASPDLHFMRLALELAAKADGETRPNPMVGAVVVRGGRVVGRGFHRRAGEAHAEILALSQAGRSARGGTLYVTLEPCRHFGRTPPCTGAILRSGIRRVVAAMSDPNPKTRGRGLAFLRSKGIRTTVGVLEKEARELNRVFVTWMTQRRPFVTVKVAQSLDGKIAAGRGRSRWISGPKARRWVHRLRSRVDGILVGVNTILKDNPRLTVRLGGRVRQPAKVVLDSKLRTPLSARIFKSGGPVIIAAAERASRQKEGRLCRKGAEVLRLPSEKGKVSLKALFRELARPSKSSQQAGGRREISHLLVEGGREVIASAFQARAVDRLCLIIAPKVIGGKSSAGVEGIGVSSLKQTAGFSNMTVNFIGPDLLMESDVHWNR